jgi:hypothetical protein
MTISDFQPQNIYRSRRIGPGWKYLFGGMAVLSSLAATIAFVDYATDRLNEARGIGYPTASELVLRPRKYKGGNPWKIVRASRADIEKNSKLNTSSEQVRDVIGDTGVDWGALRKGDTIMVPVAAKKKE